MAREETGTPRAVRLPELLRGRREDILSIWAAKVRALSPARPLSHSALIDRMPDLLTRVSLLLEDPDAAARAPHESTPEHHAVSRLSAGFELNDLVDEYKVLRQIVLELYAVEARGAVSMDEIARFDAAMDEAIGESVRTFAAARHRALQALERLATATTDAGAMEDLLRRLIRVTLETTEAVDAVVILLAEGDRLRVRAAAGVQWEAHEGFSLRFGEGFAGRIAQEAIPLELRDAVTDPLVVSPHFKAAGIHALYGVPMLQQGRVVGVAHIGSRTAYEFSQMDKLIFRTMVGWAAGIVERTELAAREREARRKAEESLARATAEHEERERALRELDRDRRVLAGVITGLPVGVSVAEAPSGRVLLMNDAMERTWGAKSEPAASVADYGVYAGYYADGTKYEGDEWPLARAVRGETVLAEEIAIDRPDGGRLITLQSAAPITDASGRVLAGVVTVLDITDRKRTEEELRNTAQFRETFLGIVSHDLRNPLNAITGSASFLLRDESLTPKETRTLVRINHAAERMARMIRDLLDFTRGRLGGALPIAHQEVDLRDLAVTAVEELEAHHPTRRIELKLEGPLTGRFDPDRVQQLLGNLGKNALDYSPEDTAVEVALSGGADRVQIRIHNEGEPIPPEMIPNLFEPYRRRREGGPTPRGALGLGLYIVRQIVEAHCGTIEVDSRAGAGTTFTVVLPRGACPPAHDQRPPES